MTIILYIFILSRPIYYSFSLASNYPWKKTLSQKNESKLFGIQSVNSQEIFM